jgi:hypothetical protein
MIAAELIETFREEEALYAFSDKFKKGKIASYISYSQVPEYLKNSEVKAWDCYEVDDYKVIFVVVKEIRE